jgi:hypothetical protein
VADRYCPSCGTEVDADARFCPSCGITLEDDVQPELPAAPSWPEPEPTPPPTDEPTETVEAPMPEAPEPVAPPPAPAPAAAPASAPATAGEAVQGADAPASGTPPPAAQAPDTGIDLPITWPTMASGWLIGIGSLLGAIALLPALGSFLNILLFLALLGLAATVFLAERVPTIPRLRLIILGVTLIGLGIALDRSAFTVRGMDTVLLLAMLAAAGGALLIELDRDRPLPPPERSAQ